MSEFKPIETQEQLDAVMSERLKQERETVKKEYDGYLSPEDVTKKYAGFLSPEDVEKKYKGYISPEEAAKKDAQIKGYESSSVKTRIAHEMGLPYELAGRLSGETEDDIRKDAENLSKILGGQKQPAPPLASKEPRTDKKDNQAAVMKMLARLKGEE